MKITRSQLRRIIKEQMRGELVTKSKDTEGLEELYNLRYAHQYLTTYQMKLQEEGYDHDVDRYGGERQHPGYEKMRNALNTVIRASAKAFTEIHKDISYDFDESNSIGDEAEAASLMDFEEDIHKPIEVIEAHLNDPTPLGMSVIDVLNHFSLPTQPIITATRELVGLAGDTDVLDFLDNYPAHYDKKSKFVR